MLDDVFVARALVIVSLGACGDAAVTPPPDGTPPGTSTSSGTLAEVTYHRDVRPLVETHCGGCHAPGGVAPTWLDDPAVVASIGDEIVDRVTRGEMPPHQPRDGCRDLVGISLFPAAGLVTLAAWRDGGFVVGDPADYGGPAKPPDDVRPPLGEPRVVLALPPFTPAPASDDHVLERTIDGAIAEDTWVVATEILPGARTIVHHATAFLETDEIPDVPAPTSIIGAWAPGYAPLRLPEGSALFAPRGARMRVLVHYSVIGLAPDAAVPEDVTAVRLWTLPSGSRPAAQAFFDAMSASDLFLPAGAPSVDVPGDGLLRMPGAPIVGVMPHMHLRGTAFRADVARADGSAACLVDAPDYDFAHQALYLFAEPVAVNEGDRHRMTCTFDNSEQNQPTVGGVRQPTRDVSWGDASTEEMCQNALLRIAPLL